MDSVSIESEAENDMIKQVVKRGKHLRTDIYQYSHISISNYIQSILQYVVQSLKLFIF